MPYASFEDLDVWKRGCRLATEVYAAVRDSRDYGLKDQMTRAAVSVPSNIAEGHERDTTPEFVRFLKIAKGSCAELRTQLYIAKRIGAISPENAARMIEECREIGAMLQGLIRSQAGAVKEELDIGLLKELKTEN